VRVRKDGQRRIYSVDRTGLAELRVYVERLWADVMDAFEEAAVEEAAQADKVSSSDEEENPHA
jgi:hypothetical protein